MKKLTRKSLSELAMMLPVVENKIQTQYVGGGNGESITKPYTSFKYEDFGEQFTDGLINTPDGVYYVAEPNITYSNDIAASYYGSGSPYSEYYGGGSPYTDYPEYSGGNSQPEKNVSTMSWREFTNFSLPVGTVDKFLYSLIPDPVKYALGLSAMNEHLNALKLEISSDINKKYDVTITTHFYKKYEGFYKKHQWVVEVKYYSKEKRGWTTIESETTVGTF